MSAPRLVMEKETLLEGLCLARGNKSEAARLLGIHRQTVVRLMQDHELLAETYMPPTEEEAESEPEEEEESHIIRGSVNVETKVETRPLPPEGGVTRYLLTSAQNNTPVNSEVWRNLNVLAEHYDAKIMVSRFTYNKGAYRRKAAQNIKPGTENFSDYEDLWYDEVITPYVIDHRVVLAHDLEFLGEMNILPTAVRPLNGFDSHVKASSGIFPHVKMAVKSVPGTRDMGAKFNYTTGTVTQQNYIQRTIGIKAQEHHVYGAVIVEVDSAGDWWVRQINARSSGVMQDLDVVVNEDGEVSTNNSVDVIVFGDIHRKFLSGENFDLCWGPDGMVDTLKPKHQVIHDVLDFRSRSPHEIKNPHLMFAKHIEKIENVEDEVEAVAEFLSRISDRDRSTIVVDSNHDDMLRRWLSTADYRDDPVNALFFLRCQMKVYDAIAKGRDLHLLANLCVDTGYPMDFVSFLGVDQSCVVGGREQSLHGHRGPDGARGSVANLNRLGIRLNTAHTHRLTIEDGVASPGVMGDLRQGYNTGPSSWSHSNLVQYLGGKVAGVTFRNNKWRAE